ncbi:MAG: hypothetical protein K8R49_06040, partial [Candidatus Cloacimonetes bacterium]|nr:hypothetical protein [Candidatus Cloacimonadota bacterium]
IYNIKGQKVKILSPSLCHPELVEGRGTNNFYSVIWNGKDDNSKDVSSGIYLIKIEIKTNRKTDTFLRKCVLIK